MKRVVIIGAGAAGCFCAIELRRRDPGLGVTVLEAGAKPMAKLAVTGGGRCNFTNSFEGIVRLEEAYPRGAQLMKRAMRVFSNDDAMAWFQREGIPYVIQEDRCVFPKSQDAMQIVRTLENLMRRLGVELRCGVRVNAVSSTDGSFTLDTSAGTLSADSVIVTTGGGALKLLEPLDLQIEKPVPSLFTLKIYDDGLRSLMGALAPDAILSLAGTPFKSSGTLLVTDWGVSGPATLKLSSYAARHLAGNGYKGTLLVNWTGWGEDKAREFISTASRQNGKKRVSNVAPDGISARLWQHIVSRAGLRDDIIWAELGSKGGNRLVGAITADAYEIAGRCHFKAEFVTCGGVSLQEVNLSTLESKKYPGLYFAGEVLDVDAITGGFNLQAAWSCAMVVARNF
ncbi:MAG: aminoacetone oxidase family FAD-binding enzyme [Bacteroidales bacterium]|nr:aminoacetone oxidase family FAD-binding enzyme [Bacteroidales bacterium]